MLTSTMHVHPSPANSVAALAARHRLVLTSTTAMTGGRPPLPSSLSGTDASRPNIYSGSHEVAPGRENLREGELRTQVLGSLCRSRCLVSALAFGVGRGNELCSPSTSFLTQEALSTCQRAPCGHAARSALSFVTARQESGFRCIFEGHTAQVGHMVQAVTYCPWCCALYR